MTGRERAQIAERDQRRSPRRADQVARLAAFRAWVMRQGADPITLADARARLRVNDSKAGGRLAELVAEGVLEKIGKGEWRLRGRTP